MMMTQQDVDQHSLYEAMPQNARDTANDAFFAAVAVFHAAGYNCPMDDAAEALVAALARYIREA